MAETKHTPGPWRVSHDGIWARSPWNAEVRIATILRHSPLNGIDSDANARLMAAAPEMLEVLKTTRGNIVSLGSAGALPKPYHVWLAVVDEAIAKAEGRS